MKKQYIVTEDGTYKRKEFYDYITSNYNLDVKFSEEHMINSTFPFVVDFKEKNFGVCESITCCACAAQNKRIITVLEFKERIRKRWNIIVMK